MKIIRRFLSGLWFIHFLVFLGLFSLYGFLSSGEKLLIFFSALSFCGALCGSLIRIMDEIRLKK